MGDPYRKLVETLREAVLPNPVFSGLHFMGAEVKEITGDCCTVFANDEYELHCEPDSKPVMMKVDRLEITDVRLKTSINGTINKDEDYFMVIPKVGTHVICGSLTGDLADLFVIQCEAVEKVVYVRGTLKMSIDGSDGKISAESDGVTVLGLFDSLANILKDLKVYTNIGPSGNPLPETISQIQAFEKDIRTIFK